MKHQMGTPLLLDCLWQWEIMEPSSPRTMEPNGLRGLLEHQKNSIELPMEMVDIMPLGIMLRLRIQIMVHDGLHMGQVMSIIMMSNILGTLIGDLLHIMVEQPFGTQ